MALAILCCFLQQPSISVKKGEAEKKTFFLLIAVRGQTGPPHCNKREGKEKKAEEEASFFLLLPAVHPSILPFFSRKKKFRLEIKERER